jgi:hypothetical protein
MKGCRWSLSPLMICTGRARRFSTNWVFNRDWVEKCLAHEEEHSSRGLHNKAEYEQQRRHMLQELADIVDAWVEGRKRPPTLYPPSMHLMPAEPTT